MTQDAARVSAVTLLLGNEARELLLCPGLPLQELLQCITAGFPGVNKPPVAVRHDSSHVYYPLSLLCRSPELFENASFHLVLDGEPLEAQEPIRKSNRHRHRAHGRKRGAKAHDMPNRREYQAVTTTSEANEEDEDVDDSEGEEKEDFEAASTEDELDLDLSDFELPQLVNVFTQACPTGALDRITFNRCLEKILSQSGRYDPQARKMFTRLFNIFEEQSTRKDIVDVADFLGGVSVFACGERDEKIQLTFELYDMDGDGFISKEEMMKYLTAVFLVIGESTPELFQQNNGLSVFCGGSSEEKIRAAFALYDYNADGYISMEEMTRYLTSVFRVLKEASPSGLQQLGRESPEELGVRTAQQAFAEADLDHDGRLSFPEFRKWYTRSNAANMERLIQNNIPEWLSLREVRRLTNLESFSAQQVLNTFAKFTAADGTMDKETFRQAFDHFKVESATQESRDRLQLLVDRIFELFDKDSNGLVDFNELASGLSVLCGGSQADKVRAAFNLYDVNHDGYISLGEMRLYLTSVFKVLFEVNPDSEARMGVTPEELGEIAAEQAFVEADHDRDGKLSFEEFSQWYMQPKRVGDLPVPAVLGEQQQERKHQVPDWVSLDVVKQMTNLEKYTADEVFEIFANRCSENGTLSREAFEECFEQLVDEQYKNDEVSLARLRLILNRLFIIFDENQDGTVDFCELTSGLSVLCGGSREEKVRAAFSLYDLNQDGFISLDEMVRYLASVFKVLYETSPGTDRKLGVRPEELATITAEQCFLEADLNEDGKLSFDEFVAWYSKSSRFEAPAAGVSSILGQQQATKGNTSESQSNGSFSRDNSKVGSQSGSPAPESPRKTVWGAGKGPGPSGVSTAPVSFPSDKIYGMTGSNGDALLSPNSASALNMNSSNMEHVRQLLKLDTYEVNDVLEIFAEAAPSGELTFAAFKKCFDQIIRLAGGHESTEERQEADAMIRRLFCVFDTDNSNTVDFGELASGLSVLSGSSMDDKVRAAFQLYDINGDGYITQEEMISYMTSIFKVMYETTDSTKTKMGVSPEELARVTAEQCFKEADLNGDNKLSFEEFKKVRKRGTKY
ncbi:Short-chain specific acyl-CoA dehydrogenase [Phytophthora nicotianae]|uniref:Short-chain specific acyl-CoA dehydrogenase n=1 Tax=Phytophthora nicotianae TaxID=4792 RepID=A0A0W8DU45_PHYNI|nr:Short-chain specific acyl-CoA dehydrogenase [Phytophthora nicotianae]